MSDSAEFYNLRDIGQLYDILQVTSSATEYDIRRAYRKLAVLYHPDKNPQGEEIFKKITFAYRVLSDEEQRKLYDTGKLRDHIRKAYDPNLDPNVELEPEQLRDFVESLIFNEELEKEKIRQAQEKKMAEMKRREDFQRLHPEFQPSVPNCIDTRNRRNIGLWPTSAELQANLHKHFTDENSLKASSSPGSTDLHGNAAFCNLGIGRKYRQEMLRNFRKNGGLRNKYMNTTDAISASGAMTSRKPAAHGSTPDKCTHNSDGACSSQQGPENKSKSFRLPFLRSATYDENCENIRVRGANFDYRSFVEASRQDKEVLNFAILADALRDYDPLN